ncbi:hypothetical protein [Clostridium kluyveri]|uniref:hypothetical protein n=1 Tax=Clostridium kluyveri TaxID=1534 RepID=UPI002247289A|nr:hypothetical protein [Clostridium kluyveri]UZQ50281.1 hypothetical protein OP486_20480 [Clostridium kluyveri]
MNSSYMKEGRFRFDFSSAISKYKPDDCTLNGLGGVDFVVELEDKFLFIELKDIENNKVPREQKKEWIERLKVRKENLFLMDLGVKFKDTLIRRWAKEENFDKPIWYLIIIEFKEMNAAQKIKLSEELSGKLPTCIKAKFGFKKEIRIKRRMILSIKDWIEKFPEFQVTEI